MTEVRYVVREWPKRAIPLLSNVSNLCSSGLRNGSVHWCDARVGSLKHHLNGFIIKKRILIMNITDLKVSYAERNKSVYARKKEK